MRTLDPIFTAAAAAGTGTPFAYLDNGANAYPIHKFRMEGFTLKAYAYDFPLTPASVYQLKRGLTIQGINYEIGSPYFIPSKIVAPMAGSAEIEINMSVFYDRYLYFTSIDASQTAQGVIEEALNTFTYNSTTEFITGETWQSFQFDQSGAMLNLNKFNGLIPMLFNKYGARIFAKDVVDSVSVFRCITRLAANQLTGDEYPWLTISTDKRTSIKSSDRTTQWNAFWTDDNGTTSRISATYPAALAAPIRNVGFFHSDLDVDDVKALHYDLTGQASALQHDIFTLPFTPQVENGDLLKVHASNLLFAEIQESFNMPGTTYPWQTKITGSQMYYSIGAE